MPKIIRIVFGGLGIVFIVIGLIIFIGVLIDVTENIKSGSFETLEPTPTEASYYQAALFVKKSFDAINNAGNKQEVIAIMPKMFSPNLQRNADFWWDFEVEYKIYGCKASIVEVYLEYFDREEDSFHDIDNPSISFSRYKLIFQNDEWIINETEEITGESSYCTLVFSSIPDE